MYWIFLKKQYDFNMSQPKINCVVNELKVTKKCFLFHLKSYVWSQDIQDVVLTFWSCRKTKKNKGKTFTGIFPLFVLLMSAHYSLIKISINCVRVKMYLYIKIVIT